MEVPDFCPASLATVIEDEITRQVAASGLDVTKLHRLDGIRLWNMALDHVHDGALPAGATGAAAK